MHMCRIPRRHAWKPHLRYGRTRKWGIFLCYYTLNLFDRGTERSVLGVFASFVCGGAGFFTFDAFVSPRPPVQLGMSIIILLLKIIYIPYLFLVLSVRCVGIARLLMFLPNLITLCL